MKNTVRFGALLIFLTTLAACSEGGQLNLIPGSGKTKYKSAPGSEFVSSSAQYETSLNRQYKVQQSTGTFTSKLSQASTPSGYTVYYSVQGATISEEIQSEQ